MYYLRIYSSEKDGSIMLPFNNDLESLITYVVDQHERIIRYLESNNKKYEKIAFIWDKDRYDETLEVSIRNFDFGIFQSMNVQIFYDLTPEYDKEMHSEERIDRREVIHLEIMKKYPLKEKGIIDLMTRPEYYFVCAFTKEMALREGMDSHTARLRVGDIGVEYILSKKAEKRYGTIYKVKENKAIPNKHCIYDEIDFEDPDWEANLEIAMCKAFLQFYPLESTLKKEKVDVTKYICWKDNIMLLEKETVSKVLDNLSRYYGVPIWYDKSIANRKLSGKLDLCESIDEVLDIVKVSASLNVEKAEGGGYHFLE